MFAIWLSSQTALAQPLNVVIGQDLAAWNAIDTTQTDHTGLLDDYQQFIQDYPTSALAEVALSRVEELQGAQEPTAQGGLSEIQQSQRMHEERLTREVVTATVVDLNPDGSRPAAKQSRWHTAIHAGAHWMNGSTAGLTGAEIRYRPVGLVTRLGMGEHLYLQSGLRVTAPGWGPFAEFSYDTRGASTLVAGGRQALKHKLWVELSGGAQRLDQSIGPVLRVELVHGL